MRALIVYSSKHGCTKRCAQAIAEALGGEADIVNLKESKPGSLDRYDKIIIGSPMYVGKPMAEVKNYCAANVEALAAFGKSDGKKLGLFVCGMLTGEQASTELAKAFPAEIAEAATATAYLGGSLDLSTLNIIEKLGVKMATKADKSFPALDVDKGASTVSTEAIVKFVEAMNGGGCHEPSRPEV